MAEEKHRHKVFSVNDDKILHLIINGKLVESLKENLDPVIKNMIEKHHFIRLLIDLTYYDGWEDKMAHQSHNDFLEMAQQGLKGKIAYINMPDASYADKYKDPKLLNAFEIMDFSNSHSNTAQALLWLDD